MQALTIATIFEEMEERLKLNLLNGPLSFDRGVFEPEMNRPGLALSGFVGVFTYQRIQVFGNTEFGYLRSLNVRRRQTALQRVFEFNIPCIIVTDNNDLPLEFLDIATQNGISVMSTSLTTTQLAHILGGYLDEKFAPAVTVHGSLVDVYGVGLLFTGRSGIGKSEIALDLVERGHRLVADDVVHIRRRSEEVLIGSGNDIIRHNMEIRGLGIIDIRSTFGVRAIRAQKRVEVEIQLEEWSVEVEYDRSGLDDEKTEILGVPLPLVRLPINPGKNVTVIAEVIGLAQLLKVYGYDPAKDFNERLIERMQTGDGAGEREKLNRMIREYLEHDYE